jgi:hypothetical protein
MVCNARIALPNDGPNLSAENLQADRGQSGRCLQSAQAAIAAMERRGQAARVVFISSMGGLRGASF